MSTLPLRTHDVLRVPNFWSGLARVGAFFVTVLDVLVEAEQRAVAAHKRLSVR